MGWSEMSCEFPGGAANLRLRVENWARGSPEKSRFVPILPNCGGVWSGIGVCVWVCLALSGRVVTVMAGSIGWGRVIGRGRLYMYGRSVAEGGAGRVLRGAQCDFDVFDFSSVRGLGVHPPRQSRRVSDDGADHGEIPATSAGMTIFGLGKGLRSLGTENTGAARQAQVRGLSGSTSVVAAIQ